MSTVNPSVPDLEAQRAELYARLAAIGDFRRGSISENYRRCGKPNCACARPDHRGHGPRRLWTRRGPGGKTVGRQLAAGEVDKVRGELDAYHRFTELTEAITAVNEAICEARPVPLANDDSGGSGGSGSKDEDVPAGVTGQKGGPSSPGSRPNSRPRSSG